MGFSGEWGSASALRVSNQYDYCKLKLLIEEIERVQLLLEKNYEVLPFAFQVYQATFSRYNDQQEDLFLC